MIHPLGKTVYQDCADLAEHDQRPFINQWNALVIWHASGPSEQLFIAMKTATFRSDAARYCPMWCIICIASPANRGRSCPTLVDLYTLRGYQEKFD